MLIPNLVTVELTPDQTLAFVERMKEPYSTLALCLGSIGLRGEAAIGLQPEDLDTKRDPCPQDHLRRKSGDVTKGGAVSAGRRGARRPDPQVAGAGAGAEVDFPYEEGNSAQPWQCTSKAFASGCRRYRNKNRRLARFPALHCPHHAADRREPCSRLWRRRSQERRAGSGGVRQGQPCGHPGCAQLVGQAVATNCATKYVRAMKKLPLTY